MKLTTQLTNAQMTQLKFIVGTLTHKHNTSLLKSCTPASAHEIPAPLCYILFHFIPQTNGAHPAVLFAVLVMLDVTLGTSYKWRQKNYSNNLLENLNKI